MTALAELVPVCGPVGCGAKERLPSRRSVDPRATCADAYAKFLGAAILFKTLAVKSRLTGRLCQKHRFLSHTIKQESETL